MILVTVYQLRKYNVDINHFIVLFKMSIISLTYNYLDLTITKMNYGNKKSCSFKGYFALNTNTLSKMSFMYQFLYTS